MLNVWKVVFIGKVFGNTCLPSKTPSGSVESRSDNSADNFRQKSVFSTNFFKKVQPPPPHSKKNYQTEQFSRNFFSWRSLYGQINTQFWHFVFNVQKTSAECLEEVKKSWRHWFNQKKTVYLKKTLQTLESSFDNHAETFEKNYVILLIIFTKTDCSISEKSYPIAYNFSCKKISMKKLL